MRKRGNNIYSCCVIKSQYIGNDRMFSLNYDKIKIKIINFHNNKIHRIIGMSPNEVAKINNENDIIRLNNLKDKEFEKINRKRIYIKINDTCIINKNFYLLENIL